MKPLIYYCRWQGAKLRLRGRDDTAVWGHLVFTDEDGIETTQEFRFNLQTSQITLEFLGSLSRIQLDEKGIPVNVYDSD